VLRVPFSKSARRLAAGCFLPLLGLLFLSGCSEQYPPDLPYGVRTDRIITTGDLNAVKPTRLDPPGQFPHLVDQFVQQYKDETKKQESPVADPGKLKPEQRSALTSALDKHFGKPAEPRVRLTTEKEPGDDEVTLAKDLFDTTPEKLPVQLAEGSKLYRRHCLHCHGLTGNGQGPTGAWVNPHPRDYRLGKFKFTSSTQGLARRKARREDLLRTLRQGVEGTSMPTFNLLPEEQLQQLISYVVHLSIRGRVEALMIAEKLLGDEPIPNKDIDGEVAGLVQDVAQQWLEAQKAVIKPEGKTESPRELHVLAPADKKKDAAAFEKQQASVKHGQKLFQTGTCMGCHSEYGRKQNLFWDEWGTIVRPANLTAGVYRGGRRPVDLFWRIHSGINGTVMPPGAGALKEEEMWDIVNFLQVLPYPQMRKVYGVEID
jgi:mono/diheme cytochrome c family protein